MVLRLPDSWSNWNLEMLVSEERGKPEYPEKNLSEQRREPTTNCKKTNNKVRLAIPMQDPHYCPVVSIWMARVTKGSARGDGKEEISHL